MMFYSEMTLLWPNQQCQGTLGNSRDILYVSVQFGSSRVAEEQFTEMFTIEYDAILTKRGHSDSVWVIVVFTVALLKCWLSLLLVARGSILPHVNRDSEMALVVYYAVMLISVAS